MRKSHACDHATARVGKIHDVVYFFPRVSPIVPGWVGLPYTGYYVVRADAQRKPIMSGEFGDLSGARSDRDDTTGKRELCGFTLYGVAYRLWRCACFLLLLLL